MKIYLAGPMTGLPDLNFPAFHAAARALRAQGHEVVNPAEICPDKEMKWADAMKRDIAELVTCDAVVVLPGWEKSRGASIEVDLAAKLELGVFDFLDFVLGAA